MDSRFLHDISRNSINAAILSRWEKLDLPNAWLVAGCLFQTVWNLQQGVAPESNIKDYDLFYFDEQDISKKSEHQVQELADDLLGDLGATIEVANQARVHIWYQTHFARPYPVLASAEDGIRRFLALETCVGVRPGSVFAPYGLDGLYAGTLTSNPLTPFPELFATKVSSYASRWPQLRAPATTDDA